MITTPRLRMLGQLTAALLLATGTLRATGIPHLSISNLVKNSDVIVVADVGQAQQISQESGDQGLESRTYSAPIAVRQFIKGTSPSHFYALYTIPVHLVGHRGLNPGTRLIFLRLENGQYQAASPYYPSFPAVETAPSPDTKCLDTEQCALFVRHKLADVLAAGNEPLTEANEVLLIAYALDTDRICWKR